MIEHLDGIHETVTYKENSSLRLFVNTDCEDYPIHWHTPMEIIMPLEGTYTVFLGDKPVLLQEGDIIFICPGILHSLVAPENGKRIILQIEWSVVSKIRLVSPVFPPFFASSVLSNNVRLRNSAICIFIRKNCRKIPNSCCYR